MEEANRTARSRSRERAQRTADAHEGLVITETYRLSRKLGSGSMGEVYDAVHVRLGSPVAVKLMRASTLADPRSATRFRREARRGAALHSENVVKVFDYGELPDGTPYLVMERLFGEDLRALLVREGPLPVRRAVTLVMEACRGLSVVHAAGLIHRDLKPSNLFVERTTDGRERCKILDFGLVKSGDSGSTSYGTVLGTVGYMAPEQLEDASSAATSADTYALAAILYECLTGVTPHRGETLRETMFDVLCRDARPPSELRALPKELDAILLRALSRDAELRFPDAAAFEAALAPFGTIQRPARTVQNLDEATLHDSPSLVGAEHAFEPRRRRWETGWLVAGALGVGVSSGWFLRGEESARPNITSSTPTTPPGERIRPPAERSPALTQNTIYRERPASSVVPEPSVAVTSAQPHPPRIERAPRLPKIEQQPAAPVPRIGGRFDPNNPYE